MQTAIHRNSWRIFSILAILAVITAAPMRTTAQSAAQDQAYPAMVQDQELPVRSGAGTNYYSFGTLKQGDIVTVVGELYGFARIATKGRAFAKFHGLIPVENAQVAADGTSATTLGRTVISAPNLDRDGLPSQSWQRLVRLDVGQKLTILGKVEEAGKNYYKIALPDMADGWVPLRSLRRATPEEVTAYNARPIEPTPPATDPNAREQAGNNRERADNSSDQVRNNEVTPPTPPTRTQTEGSENQTSPPTTPLGTREESATTEESAESAQNNAQSTQNAADSQDSSQTGTREETDGTAAETGTTTAPPAQPTPPAKPASVERFESLEKSYETLLKEPVRQAEIAPLLSEYRTLAADQSADERVRAMAETRIAMLEIRRDLQIRLEEIDKLRARADLGREETAAARLVIQRSGDYDAVGRLTASTVYTGDTLPRLLRIVDPANGRTVAYFEPDDRFDYAGMIGQYVGISGEKRYDAGLRLTLITPRNVEMLTASPRN